MGRNGLEFFAADESFGGGGQENKIIRIFNLPFPEPGFEISFVPESGINGFGEKTPVAGAKTAAETVIKISQPSIGGRGSIANKRPDFCGGFELGRKNCDRQLS